MGKARPYISHPGRRGEVGGAKATPGTPGSGLAHRLRAPDSRWHPFQAPVGVFYKSRSDPYSPALALSAPGTKLKLFLQPPGAVTALRPGREQLGIGRQAGRGAARRRRKQEEEKAVSLRGGLVPVPCWPDSHGWLPVPCARLGSASGSERVKQKILTSRTDSVFKRKGLLGLC